MSPVPPKPDLDDLFHFGVKGMRWGVHRSESSGGGGGGSSTPSKHKPTTSEIKTARRSVRSQQQRIIDLQNDSVSAGARAVFSKDARRELDSITKEYRDLTKKLKDDPARAVAARTTRGEKVAFIVIAGPFGALPIAAGAAASKGIERGQRKRAARTGNN
jgi:hypothetical protein